MKSRLKWAEHVERIKTGSTTNDGICSPVEGTEKERKTTYEMARLHRERRDKGGVGGRGLEDCGPGRGQWRRVVHRAAET